MNRDSTFEDSLGFFPFGVQYHRSPTPLPAEWEPDLREIAAAGYTHVQFRPQWRWHERIRGTRTWDDLDRLFDLAEQNRLKVVLKPMLETAPDWVFSELGGTRIGFHGTPIKPVAHGAYYIGGWWPCFDNPQVVETAVAFVEELTRRYAKHPALWFYDAWNEPVSRPMGQCHCCHSTADYRRWLARRFKTIENLNDFLGKAWTSFESVEPPAAAADYAEMFFWRQWAAQAVANHVSFVARAIRRCDPNAFILVHAGSPTIAQDPVCATSDDLLNSRDTDRFGSSFGIPLHPVTPMEHAAPDFQSDWLRRVDPNYWCHEFYPNRGEWCRPPEPSTLRRLIWIAIAGGARGLTFWQYRSERVGCETNGYGIREINGAQTVRGAAVEEIGAKLREFGPRLAKSRRKPSRVAIMHSRESDMIARVQHIRPWPNDIAQESPSDRYFYKQAIKAAHALYLMEGYEVEWVIPGDDLADFDLVHVAACEMISAELAESLRHYARRGGRLIIEFPFACRDANTWVSPERPNQSLDDLIGATESDRVVIGAEKALPVDFGGGLTVPVRGWKIDLVPRPEVETVACWPDEKPAALSHRFGDGKVVTLGASLAASFHDSWDDPARKAFRSVLEIVGAPRPQSEIEGLWIRRRYSEGEEIVFIFNVTDSTKTIDLPAFAPPSSPQAVQVDQSGTERIGAQLRIGGGGYWIGQFSIVPASELAASPLPAVRSED